MTTGSTFRPSTSSPRRRDVRTRGSRLIAPIGRDALARVGTRAEFERFAASGRFAPVGVDRQDQGPAVEGAAAGFALVAALHSATAPSDQDHEAATTAVTALPTDPPSFTSNILNPQTVLAATVEVFDLLAHYPVARPSRPMPAGGSIARAGAEWTGERWEAAGAGDRWRTAPGEAQGPPSPAATQPGAELTDELTDGERVAGEEDTSA
jgi:hypothetical protein